MAETKAADRNYTANTLRLKGPSDDKKSALVEIDTPDGLVTLSIAEEKLGGLFTTVCAAISALAEANTGRPQSFLIQPDSWGFSRTASGRLAVKFLLDGTELTFAVPTSQIAGAIQALQGLQAETMASPPPAARRH